MNNKLELVCPAGNLPALRAAVDNGADAVYIGFRDGSNARNFPGLNFSVEEARQGINYASAQGVRVFLALNIYPQPPQWKTAVRAIDAAVDLGIDALILADPGLMRYCVRTYPELRLHLSVQASATNRQAIDFYHEQFEIKRVVLPRVLSLAQVQQLVKKVPVDVEVFGFGSLCVMVEGRCALSSYVTGDSPNTAGNYEERYKSYQGRRASTQQVVYSTGDPDVTCRHRCMFGRSRRVHSSSRLDYTTQSGG